MLIVFLLVLSACGSASNSGSSTNSEQKNVKKNTLSEIKKRGKLVIATSGNFRPFTFTDTSTNLKGYDIDWGNQIAKHIGVKVEYVTGDLSGLLAGLNAGKYDLVMSGLLETPQRKAAVDFSETYYKDGTILVAKKGSNVKDVNHMAGKIIGVISGSAQNQDVTAIGGYKQLKEYPGNSEALSDLKSGRIEAYAVTKIAATDFLKNDPEGSKFRIFGEPYKMHDAGIAIMKNNPTLKKVVDEVVQQNKKDGTYDKLSKKWFGFTVPK